MNRKKLSDAKFLIDAAIEEIDESIEFNIFKL